MGYIYKITNPINMTYIGQTVSLRKRLMGYYGLKPNKPTQSIINDSILTFGFNAHTFQVLEKDVPLEQLSEREEYWIRKLNTVHALNPAGMNTNRYDKNVVKRVKNVNQKEYYHGLEEWDYAPFTGEQFLQKSIELKKKLTSEVNKRTNRDIPDWSRKLQAEKLKKPIICYDINGNFIREFDSTVSAVEELDIPRSSIKDSLRQGCWSRGKYMFKYKTENYPLKISVEKVTKHVEKKEVIVFREDWRIIERYPSSIEAGKAFALKDYLVRRFAQKKGLVMYKDCYRFVYAEDYHSSIPSEMEGGDKPLI